MKKILFIAFVAISFVTPKMYAKDDDYKVVVAKNEASGSYSYESVVPVENVKKEEMFARAKKWIITNLKTADNNIQFDTTDLSITNSSTLILKSGRGFNWAITSGLMNFKLNLMFKDGRYKFVFDNIAVQIAYSDGVVETLNYDQVQRNNGPSKFIRKGVNEKLSGIEMQLETAVKNGGAAKDNW